MTRRKPTHGGRRRGAGRPDGPAKIRVGLYLTTEVLALVDSERGEVDRSVWVERKLWRIEDAPAGTVPRHPQA